MPTATSTEFSPSHHVTLTPAAGGTGYGLVLVRLQAGEDGGQVAVDDPTAIQRQPLQRTTLKTSSGETKYSDFSEPFTPIPQDDWTGGRGNDDFESDRSRFYDSYRLNTWMNGQIILGPRETYSTG